MYPSAYFAAKKYEKLVLCQFPCKSKKQKKR
jgi:hypothetical protein